jgi:hypothetical protein
MATVAIDIRKLDELPALCVKTGVPTNTSRSQGFGDIPGWTLLLIFWGVIPFLIAAGFARRKVTVELPVSEDTLRRTRLVDLGSISGLVLGIGLLVTALLTGTSAWAWLGITLAGVTLVAGAVGRHLVWVSGRLEGEVLWLYGVDPSFAQAVEPLTPSAPGADRPDMPWMPVLLAAALLMLLLFFWLSPRS